MIIALIISFFLMCFFYLIGFGLEKTIKGSYSHFDKLLIGLVATISTFAIVYTSFKTIFIVILLIPFYYLSTIFFKRKVLRTKSEKNKLPSKEWILKASLFLLFSSSYFFISLIKNQGSVLHHDFLYYIDISWYIESTGVETIYNDPINTKKTFVSGYHYFIPWLLIIIKNIGFGLISSYNSLNLVIFPLLTTFLLIGISDFLKTHTTNQIVPIILAPLPLLTYAFYIDFFEQIPHLQDSDRFTYGILNSYFGGKMLVNSIFILPILISVEKENYTKAKLLFGILPILSMLNAPIALISLVMISCYELITKKIKFGNWTTDIFYAFSIFICIQVFYSGMQFIPTPPISAHILNFTATLRTSTILIIEAMIQFGILFLPILATSLFAVKLFKKQKIWFLTVPIVIVSSIIWILFRDIFGSSEFFKLNATNWMNLSIGLAIALVCIQLIDDRNWKPLLGIILASLPLGIIAHYNGFNRSHIAFDPSFQSEISKQTFKKGEILLDFNVSNKEFLNLPGDLNPFVHRKLDLLYTIEEPFYILSGTKALHPDFDSLLKNHPNGTMLRFDPFYQFTLSDSNSIDGFMSKNTITKIICDTASIPLLNQEHKYKVIKNSNSKEALLIRN